MYAIIRTGGKQYRVAKDDVIDVELLDAKEGETIEFKEVLFVADGNKHQFGEPGLANFAVKGEVVGQSAGPKIKSMKYTPREHNKRQWGHRQHYHRVKITVMGGGSSTKTKGEEKPKASAKADEKAEKPKAKAAPKAKPAEKESEAAKPAAAKAKAAPKAKTAPKAKAAPKETKSTKETTKE